MRTKDRCLSLEVLLLTNFTLPEILGSLVEPRRQLWPRKPDWGSKCRESSNKHRSERRGEETKSESRREGMRTDDFGRGESGWAGAAEPGSSRRSAGTRGVGPTTTSVVQKHRSSKFDSILTTLDRCLKVWQVVWTRTGIRRPWWPLQSSRLDHRTGNQSRKRVGLTWSNRCLALTLRQELAALRLGTKWELWKLLFSYCRKFLDLCSHYQQFSVPSF